MFSVDALSRTPVYEQLIEQIERYVLIGVLKPGEQLPSVRAMSVSLAVNPNTIQKAYSDLDSRKIIFSVPGKGCFISENAAAIIGNAKKNNISNLKEMLLELKLAGTKKSELIELIDSVFDERSTL